jgi:hypothetical protein
MEDFFTTNIGIRIITIVFGIAVLTLGRKLFWLATAVAGFILGLGLVIQSAPQLPDWLTLMVALLVGVIGAVLAVFVQKAAVGIAGLILGGYTLTSVLTIFDLGLGEWAWLLFIIGGILGLVLALALLEPALIVLSTLAGAILIVQAVNFSPLITGILFIGLLVVGFTVQSRMFDEKT